jgi:hypothetical protein
MADNVHLILSLIERFLNWGSNLFKPRLVLKDGIFYDRKGNAFCPVCRDDNTKFPIALTPVRRNDEEGWAEYSCPMLILSPKRNIKSI